MLTLMPQLHLYLRKDVADEVKRRARTKGMSVSKYLADLVQGQVTDQWPERFFTKVVGGWKGEPLKRPEQIEPELRDEL
jgi:hypothetical protein